MRSLLLVLVTILSAGQAAFAEDAVNKPIIAPVDLLRDVSEVEIYDRLAWVKATDLLDALGRLKPEGADQLYLAAREMVSLSGEQYIVGIFQRHGYNMGGLPLVIVLFDDSYRPIVWGRFDAAGSVAWATVLQPYVDTTSEAELAVIMEPVRALKNELVFGKYLISRSGIKLVGQGGQWPLAVEKK
ncbi:hypothetical protein DB345_06315 [Spartobacteria bacterium LR76]|nr:hypothetical protein DB345_06315 [Spartobacteria bacterium LR76]